MAKTKRKHLAAIAAMKESKPSMEVQKEAAVHFEDEKKPTKLLFNDDDPWVEVRKQRVIIIIPPLPATHHRPLRVQQGSKEKPTETKPACGTVNDQNFSTRKKIRRGRTVEHTKMNRNNSKVISKVRGRHKEKIMNNAHPLDEPAADSSTLRFSETRAEVQVPNNLDTTLHNDPVVEAVSQRSINPSGKQLKVKGRRGRPFAQATVKRRRDTNSDYCLTNGIFQAADPLVLGFEDLPRTGKAIDLEQATHLDATLDSASHQEAGPSQGDCAREKVLATVQTPSKWDLPRIQENGTTKEDLKIIDADSLLCDELTRFSGDSVLQQHTISILQEDTKEGLNAEKNFSLPQHALTVLSSETEASVEVTAKSSVSNKTKGRPQSQIFYNDGHLNPPDWNKQMMIKGSIHPDMKCMDGKRLVQSNSKDEKTEMLSDIGDIHPSLSTNQVIRATTLKKQLEKAGGLSRWLFSMGLQQFVEVFKNRKLNEVELLQLRMDDLKEMGINSVGPRRKLIWAINHLCQQIIG